MSHINITDLTFCYDGSYDNIFENVSFRIDTDWKLGFIGRNGRGKTTFLNLLLGKYEYGGTISASVDFDYFPFEIPDGSADTIDVIGRLDPECPQWEIERELSLLEVPEDALRRPFDTLSFGERTKVMLAVLFLRHNNFLLIDEPTNHLDMQARRTVGEYLKSKQGFILVSHDRAFLDSCIDHVLSINRAGIEVQKGNFSSWFTNRERQDNFELGENEKLKAEISHLEAAARRTGEWSAKVESTKIGFDPSTTEKSISRRSYAGEKSRKLMKRSKTLESRQQKAIDDKTKLLKNLETREDLKISPLQYHAARLITLDKVSIRYDGRKVCDDVSFTVDRGDRIALTGKNGSGKTSLLKLIRGEQLDHSGNITVGSRLQISYVSQDTSQLSGDLSEFAARNGIDESLFKAILRKLDFARAQFEKRIEDFSAGQKKKILIAHSLCERAHLYVWDEPLNFIDVISRMQIEELLLQHKPTILFVEHDSEFCKNVATKVVLL